MNRLPKCDASLLVRLPKEMLEQIDEIAFEMGGRRADAVRLIMKKGIPQINEMLKISTTESTNA